MNREQFISHLTKDGLYDAEEAEKLANEQFADKVATPDLANPFSEERAAQDVARQQQELVKARAKEEGGLTGFWHGLSGAEKVGLSTAGAVGTGLAMYGAHQALKNTGAYDLASTAGKAIKDRMFGQQPVAINPLDRIDPEMDASRLPASTKAPPTFQGTEQQAGMIQRSEEIRNQKNILASIKATKKSNQPIVSGAVAPYSQERMAGTLAGQEMRNPLGGQASAYMEPLRPPTVTQAIANGQSPTQALQIEVAKEIDTTPPKNKGGRPTKAQQEEKLAAAQAFVPPEGAQKIPEKWGKGMGWLVGRFGVEGAQAYVDKYNNGKPFESHKDFTKSWESTTGERVGPSYHEIPKDIRKARGIAPVSPQFKIEKGFAVPPVVPVMPPSSGGGMGGGGGAVLTGKPTTPGGFLHNLNPMRLE